MSPDPFDWQVTTSMGEGDLPDGGSARGKVSLEFNVQGVTAYEIAVANGFAGSEAEWLLTLKGADGQDGADGPAGPAGTNGTDGTNGAPGTPGAPGTAGAKGDTGATGLTGAAGTNGTNGAAGAKGDKGDKGDIGLTGATGATGAKGDKGDTGATGATGAKGDTGATGPKGDPGEAGTGTSTFAGVTYVTAVTEAAFRAAINSVIAARSSGTVRSRIQLGFGNYVIASPDLISSPTGGNSDQIFGLEIHGMGPRITTITFTNPGATLSSDPRQNNLITAAQRLRYFKMQDMTVNSTNAANNMLWAWSVSKIDANSIYPEYGYGQNQRCQFINIEWQGPWNRVIGIDGDVNANNNSEWLLRDCCTTNSSVFGDAFLHCGGISGSFTQQAQFLNFRIDNCNMTLNGGSVFKFDRGGAITVIGGSWSAASSSSGAITWFDLTRPTDITAMSLLVEGVRFEPKAGNHLIIDCAWGDGHISFKNISDVASLQYAKGSPQANYNLHRYTGQNNRIPTVVYEDSTLVGVHKVTGFNGGHGRIVYERSTLYHWDAAYASASGATDGFLQWASGAKPRSSFHHMDDGVVDQLTA